MAEPQITLGMKFETYSEMKTKLKEKYYELPEKEDVPAWIKSDKKDEIYSYREIYKDENGKDDSVSGKFSALSKKSIFMSKVEEDLYQKKSSVEVMDANLYYYGDGVGENANGFNYIISEKQIAIDINEDGTVNEGEIFDLPKSSGDKNKVDYKPLWEKLKNSNWSLYKIITKLQGKKDFMRLYNELEEKAVPVWFED